MDSPYHISVSVAVPTFNREAVLIETLEQVLAQDPPADEVLVVDQTPEHEPETEAYLHARHEEGKLRWIRHSPPNLNAARNRAVWETACEVLILIDDDVDLVPGFIEKHARNYDDPTILAVAGRTIQANGNTPAAKATPWVRPLGFEPFALDGTERLQRVASFIGANHSVRVSAIRAVGGYDPHYVGPLYNESDAALELSKLPGRVVFDPEAKVDHKQMPGGGVRKASSQSHPEYWMSFSTVYFHMKHFFPGWYFWKQVFFVQFRRRVFYKRALTRPWRMPWSVLSYGYSIGRAARICRQARRERRAASVVVPPSCGNSVTEHRKAA